MRPESYASGLALHSWCVNAGHSNRQPNDGCIVGNLEMKQAVLGTFGYATQELPSRRMKASVSRLQQVYSKHVAQNPARAVT